MPLIHATRAPTQGTALLQVSPAVVSFNPDFHGKVPEAGVVRRNLLHSLVEWVAPERETPTEEYLATTNGYCGPPARWAGTCASSSLRTRLFAR